RKYINKNVKFVEKLVYKAGTAKRCSIAPPPAIGGIVAHNINPFDCIFTPPYEMNLIPTIIDIIDGTIGVIESDESFSIESNVDQQQAINIIDSKRIFLVHGRDNELKESTARFLEKLDLEAIILHEQSSRGQTIIEKFEANSDVAFAVVLITPDDIGGLNVTDPELKPRARQNVLFELGYFIGKLGRHRVIALLKDDIEIPSDFDAVVYIEVNRSDDWKFKLAKELKDGGLEIDLNKVVS
ncbi:MAG: hypothetical protein GQ534_00315, partial [Candidatus Delongbacteria bacterium]|nr:hypothetical protein [Candidatus Delongbacteria bacterium]